MTKIKATALLFAILTLPNLSWAVPVNWNFPSTVILAGSNNSVSGSFTFDADTNTLSNMSLVVTLNGVATPIATAGLVDATWLRIVQANTLNLPGVYINRTTLTNGGGTVQIPGMGAGPCTSISSGLCNNVFPSASAGNATISGVPTEPPVPIPSLSQWSLILLTLLLGMLGVARLRQRA